MRKVFSVGVAGALLVTIGACASRKAPVEEVEVAEPPPVIETKKEEPPPVVVEKEKPPVVVDTGPEKGTLEDFVVNVGDRVYFDYDQYTLDATDRDRLNRQAAWLQAYPGVKILVAGNCDERGTREYNLALGARRAEAVKSYLVSLGVDGSRIQTVSYGKERPVDPRSVEEAWSLNRNSQTQIVKGTGT